MSNLWRSPFVLVCFVTLAVLLSGVSRPARAASFTINSINDNADYNPGDGACDVDSETTGSQCTFRAALQEANALEGADAIDFAIPGTGVKTITPVTALPTITEAVTIDGYTQGGSRTNTSNTGTNAVILIELNGADIPSATDGLHFSSSGCTLSGLVINGFGGNGILSEGGDIRITGCFIGTNAAGTAKASNGGNGILLFNFPNSSIGGTVAAAKNLISANGSNGISIQSCNDNSVQGNIIGMNASATVSLGNGGSGVAISGGNNILIGGNGPNIISHNGGDGISISGVNNLVASNVISFNGGRGIQINAGNNNALRSNLIYDNSGLGIDLAGDNVTANDDGDADAGPNYLQNFPVLAPGTVLGNGAVRVSGTLNSTPNTTFTIDFFESNTADPSGFGEGEKYVTSVNVTTNESGNVSFNADSFGFPAGHVVTATATERLSETSTSGNTSEFSAAVNIPSTLSINDVTVTEGNSGTTNANFTVTLTVPSTGTVTVDYATGDGTAKTPADYTARSGTLTFTPGQTTKNISVPIVGDTLDEGDENFFVNLSNPIGATLKDAQGRATIRDDDTASISVNDVSVTEGNFGTTNAVFTVTLSTPSSQAVGIAYITQNGSATAPSDYAARSGTLTIAPGATTGTISVPVVGDTLDEPNETFTVRLSSPSSGVIADGLGTGTIQDDDSPPSLSINDVTITEGNSGTTNAVFTITLSSASAQRVSVAYATQDGSATAPADYTTRSGTLTIAPGATTGIISVPIVGDRLDEPNETFTVRLGNPINTTLSNTIGSCIIQDDDVLGLDLTITPNSAAEGAGATATITRSGSDNAAALTVTLASSSSRVTLPPNIVIPVSAASTTFRVNVVDNQIADGDLNVTITASATGFPSSNAAFQVRDNETAKLTLSVAPNAFVENAGNAAAVGTVTRNTPSGAALTVGLKSSNTGAATVPATVTIAAGATIATFPIAAVDDTVVDGVQSAVITASATGLLSASATVRVADDDNVGRPPNDNFNQAQSISGAQGTVTGRTLNATHETGEPNHADSDGSHSVWYQWTAPAAGTVTFDTEGSAFDTVLAIYTGTAVNALTLIDDDDDDGSGATSRVRFVAVAGVRYFIAVDGYREEQGSLVLRWNLTTGKPTNDDIAGAQVIVGNAGQVSGDNRGATQESGEPRHAGEIGGVSVWYQWTAPASGTATFDTRGSVFDTLLAVYTTNINPPQANVLTVIAYNDDTSISTVADGDDDTDGDDTDDLTSRVSFEAVAGRTYFIAVDGFQSDQGALVLNWNLTVSSGTPIRWDKKDASGQGQSGNWNNPDNWLPRRVPQSGDLVSIKLPGIYAVTLDVDANVTGIALGGSSGAATLAIGDKRLVLSGRSTVADTGIVQLSGGTLFLTSDCIVSGTFGWSGGQLQGAGTLHLLRSARLSITGDGAKVLALNVLVNDGVATWQGSGSLVLNTNARLVNNGQFTSRVAGIVRNQGGGESPKFFNYGTFTSTATGTSQFVGVEFWNAGRGNIQAGVLQLRGGGASYGVFDLASGARLEFSSDFFFAKDASRIIGGGQAEQLGGIFVVNTDDGEPVEVRDFELSAGSLNGANSQSRLEVNEFRWTGGAISGKGQVTLKDNFRITGSGSRSLMGQTLTSQGNADWNGTGPLTIGDGAVINIQGNLYTRDGFTISTSPGKAPVLNNSGTINPGDAVPDANVRTRALTPLATGLLNIFCNYHQAASGILNLDVRGTRPGSDYDQVNVRGDLTIDPGAKIEVNLPTGVTPQVGDRYRVITFTERTGEFLLDFSKVVGLPSNLDLLPVYSTNALDIVVVSKVVTEAPFISGRVTDSQKNSLVNVTVKRVGANNQVVTTTTDSNGYYAFNRVPPGSYLVSPVANGLVFGVANVTVSATRNAPDTNFAGAPLNFSSSSKAGGDGKIPSAPSS